MEVCRGRCATVLGERLVNVRPQWLKVRAPSPKEAEQIKILRDILTRYHLTTVCQGANCPNAVECWSARTATFMLLGKLCTRTCHFCGVPTSDPGGVVDWEEPARLRAAVDELGLSYVVLTSVDRDDLQDGGAKLLATAIAGIKDGGKQSIVEALVPDFSGDEQAITAVAAAGADVIGHNLETVRRLSPHLRDRRAGYDLSLHVLGEFKRLAPASIIKSSLILGMGETRAEILQALRDLRNTGVDAVTLGQYLQPTGKAIPVARYLLPEDFDEIAQAARRIGFRFVMSGPLVRSSYHASEMFKRECAS